MLCNRKKKLPCSSWADFTSNVFWTFKSFVNVLIPLFSLIFPSLLSVFQRSVRHHWTIWQENCQHAHVLLWSSARLLCHAILPHRDCKPVCHPAETWAPGCLGGSYWALWMDKICLHVQLWLRWETSTVFFNFLSYCPFIITNCDCEVGENTQSVRSCYSLRHLIWWCSYYHGDNNSLFTNRILKRKHWPAPTDQWNKSLSFSLNCHQQ